MPSHPRTKCPHCESTLRRIRTQTHTKLIKEIVMSCPNEECQCVFVAIEEIFREVAPSHRPNADIEAMLSTASKKP